MACVPPCPTGSIDNWRQMPRSRAYSVEAQFEWDSLPTELNPEELGVVSASGELLAAASSPQNNPSGTSEETAFEVGAYAPRSPPWSAATPYANLYGPKAATRSVIATVVGNVRVTDVGKDYDTHHIVLDFGGDAGLRCSKGSRSASCLPGRIRGRADRIIRANIRSRVRATANGRATTTSRSP